MNFDGSVQRLNRRYPGVGDLFLRRSPEFLKRIFEDKTDTQYINKVGKNVNQISKTLMIAAIPSAIGDRTELKLQANKTLFGRFNININS